MPTIVRGVDLIAEERRRQVLSEGYDSEHDDRHDYGELAVAGACYALHDAEEGDLRLGYWGGVPEYWPWDDVGWKPSESAIRNLVRAGALICAEIDRRLRNGDA